MLGCGAHTPPPTGATDQGWTGCQEPSRCQMGWDQFKGQWSRFQAGHRVKGPQVGGEGVRQSGSRREGVSCSFEDLAWAGHLRFASRQ